MTKAGNSVISQPELEAERTKNGKTSACAKRGKICINLCQALENMLLVTGAKRVNVSIAGIHVNSGKPGKIS